MYFYIFFRKYTYDFSNMAAPYSDRIRKTEVKKSA